MKSAEVRPLSSTGGAQRFSPIRYWNQLDPLQVKQAIQQALAQWGLPQTMRMDNGTPWGTHSPVLSVLGLMNSVPCYAAFLPKNWTTA